MQNIEPTITKNHLQTIIMYFVLVILSRTLSHAPNFSPITLLAFLSPCLLSKRLGLPTLVFSLFVSDITASFIHQLPIFGSWTFITYGGYALIYAIGCFYRSSLFSLNLFLFIPCLSLLYWIWSNLGVWILTTLYSHTLAGLWHCCIMALPFLRNAILGDMVWLLILRGCYHFYYRHHHKMQTQNTHQSPICKVKHKMVIN